MTRWIEIAIFIALALVLHIAFFATAPARGSESQGAGGAERISLQGASAQIAEMVQEWEAPPTVQETAKPALTPPPAMAPPIPAMTAPLAPTAPRDLPQMIAQQPPTPAIEATIDTQPAAPPQRYAPTTSDRPQARPVQRQPEPEPQPQPRQTSAGQAEQRAAGTGGGAQAGQSQTSNAPTLTAGQSAQLEATWGAQILRRIERRKRAPRNVRGSNDVRVTLTIGRDGQLLSSAIQQSSGVQNVDQAALRAVSRAAPFPAAPAGLTQGSYRFGLIISFDGR